MTNSKTITIHTEFYFDNIIATIDFSDIKLPDWLERELSKRELHTQTDVSFLDDIRQLKMVISCNADNPFNPKKEEVEENEQLITDIVENLNTKVV